MYHTFRIKTVFKISSVLALLLLFLLTLLLMVSCNSDIKNWKTTTLREADIVINYPPKFDLVDYSSLPYSEIIVGSENNLSVLKSSGNKIIWIICSYYNIYEKPYDYQFDIAMTKQSYYKSKITILDEKLIDVQGHQFVKLEMKIDNKEDQPYYVLELFGRYELGRIRTKFIETRDNFKCLEGDKIGFHTRFVYKAPYDENWKEHQKEAHKIISHLEFDNR